MASIAWRLRSVISRRRSQPANRRETSRFFRDQGNDLFALPVDLGGGPINHVNKEGIVAPDGEFRKSGRAQGSGSRFPQTITLESVHGTGVSATQKVSAHPPPKTPSSVSGPPRRGRHRARTRVFEPRRRRRLSSIVLFAIQRKAVRRFLPGGSPPALDLHISSKSGWRARWQHLIKE